ncbi:MAG TPA: hypothetical protein VII49_02710 [Rhizomicrobium sp.]
MKSSMHATAMNMEAPCVPKNHGTPCKLPSGGCAYVCGTPTSVGLIFDLISLIAPAVAGTATWNFQVATDGITRPPALPPPILSA